MPNAAHQRELVDLEPLAWPAPVPEPATRHLGLDLLDRDLETSREPLDHDDEGLTVRLAGGEETEHPGRDYP
jgi:hypothetical protein